MLRGHTTDINFSEVRMEGIGQPLCLPRELTVTWKLGGRTYRNRHQYSDYKLFSVASDYKIDQPQISK